jgi:hypothetical protein
VQTKEIGVQVAADEPRRPEMRDAITEADIDAYEACGRPDTEEAAEEWRVNFDKYQLIKLCRIAGFEPTELTEERAKFLVDNVKMLACKYRMQRWMESVDKQTPENVLAKLRGFYSKRYGKTYARYLTKKTASDEIKPEISEMAN